METREIDRRLQRYTAAEHRIGANLQELEQHSVYQLLTTDVLVGETAKALAPLKGADPGLWDLFSLLGSTLDRARTLRGTNNRFSYEDRTTIAELLAQKSILIQATNVSLGERSLTGQSVNEERVSVEELIDRMGAMYRPIRDAISHAEQVLREVLPRLSSAEATLKRLQGQADALGVQAIELDRIAETIATVGELSVTDPMAIPAATKTTLDRALHDVAAMIAKARTSHDELASDIAAASDLLDNCRELIVRANRNREDSIAKIARPINLRHAPSMAAIDGDRGLANTLAPILASTQPWQVVRRQLDAWMAGAERMRSQLQRVAATNQGPLDKRAELRGRLTAFRAKMAAVGLSEDPVLSDISAEAHSELYTAPTDLARAEKLVTEFGKRLVSS